ncbi:protein FAM162A isoform X1 [Emydura macquarii macquarii]|uniref:protein FAM162A isoform X1 n=1 Tax=Emydura macquarii macquarii TaxID=1129001 RepID=UPI00352B5D90
MMPFELGRATKMLERNVPSILRPTKGMDLKIKRGFCSKSQEGSKQKPEVEGHTPFTMTRHKPSDWEKKVLLWSGRFKKADDIPEIVSHELLDSARNKLRVKISYVMIALTILGCIVMVIKGKRAAERHESLATQNLEKKARWREEIAQSASAKP